MPGCYTTYLHLEYIAETSWNPSLHFGEDWNSAFHSACEEDERINQSATCLFNVNDLLSTCPSADCNWQTDFDRKLLLADCLSCVLSVSDHHFSFCPLLQMKVEDKERRKRGEYFRKLWNEGEIWAPVEEAGEKSSIKVYAKDLII